MTVNRNRRRDDTETIEVSNPQSELTLAQPDSTLARVD